MRGAGTGVATARGDARETAPSRTRHGGSTSIPPVDPLADLRPVGPGAVIDGGFELLRHRFGRLVGLSACLYIPIWLVDLSLTVFGNADGASDGSGSPIGPAFLLVGNGSTWVVPIAIAQSLALSVLGLCVGHLVMAATRGDDVAFADLGRLALRRSWVALLILPLNAAVHFASVVTLGFGFPLVDAFVFIVSVVAGAEGVGPWTALRRSFSLTRAAYGRALVISFGGLCITQVLRLSFFFGPSLLVSMLDPSTVLSGLVSALGVAVLLIAEPLTACIAARAYLDLRCRVEGLDLVLRQHESVVS